MTLTCTDPSEVNDIIIDAKGAGSIPSITVRLINILNCLIGESHFSARQQHTYKPIYQIFSPSLITAHIAGHGKVPILRGQEQELACSSPKDPQSWREG
jgi:hypothetical protein